MTKPLRELTSQLQTYRHIEIDEARALPMDVYTSIELFDLEMDAIFRKDWICVGRLEQVPEIGDFFTIEIAGEPIVVVRGKDGVVRALSSVCRHRYMTVANGRGNVSRFICPYHRWVYKTDGKLSAAPHMEKPTNADGSECRLPEFKLDSWLGFIFVNLSENPLPLEPQMAGAAQIMEPYEMESWQIAVAYDDVWAGNWKLGIETGLEAYHIEGLHPTSFAGLMTSKDSRFQQAGGLWNVYRNDIHFDHPLGEPLKAVAENLGGDERTSAPTLSIYPAVNISGTQGNTNWLSFLPISPGETRVIGGFLVPPEEYERLQSEPEELKVVRESIETINEEDASAMVDLQRNARSRFAQPGKLNTREEALLWFYRYLADRLETAK